jgi:DNA (cytosine-5)-methyltransferase 1
MHIYNANAGQMGLHLPNALIVDNFAGGGGASMGLEIAFNRPVDIAINHNPEAISMHLANHPDTEHYCESVWDVDPIKATYGLPVEWAHFSPDCTHHSKARGGKPKKKEIRGLAWIVIKWAILKHPEKISLENVEEFKTWGPLDNEGQPIKERAGETFDAFILMLTTGIKKSHPAVKELREFLPAGFDITAVFKGLGYNVDFKELRACDYGIPTTRKRFFMVARCDGDQVKWPEPTHGKGLLPYKTAVDCIDWSIPCPSIFTRKKPLVENTMKRIAKGLKRFVIDAENPYLIDNNKVTFITEHANASNQRNMPGDEPLRTICAGVKGGHFALVTAFLVKHYGGNYTGAGIDMRAPLDTITTTDHHALVSAFLVKYYGNDKDGCDINQPLHTITTNDRFGLVLVKINGETYQIIDIGMRMLAPKELYMAQGFPEGYIHDRTADGKPLSKTAQVRMVGNSVPPGLIAAIAKANTEQQQKNRRVA